MLPSDGEYCLKTTATDRVGNIAEAKVTIKVDTHAPAAPVLAGKIDNNADAVLDWAAITEPDLAGYNVYSNGQKLNATVVTDLSYRDLNPKEGIYTYSVKSVDMAGNESAPSNSVKLTFDVTPPTTRIGLPQDGMKVANMVEIKGTAFSPDDSKQYRVYSGTGSTPTNWNLIRTSPVPVPYGALAQWDTITLVDGTYSVKLEAEDLHGNMRSHQIVVTVDNAPPGKPQLLTATKSGSKVTLTWQANAETDLAGYLVYGNDKLVGTSGPVTASLKSYLRSGTTYVDTALPDGKYAYYLVAMDQVGNLSDQSDSREVNLDVRPPHAQFKEPNHLTYFSKTVYLNAESPDADVASIKFQYKKPTDTLWTDLGSPISSAPYSTYFDPGGYGLAYGNYQLRAVATDVGGRADPAPTAITVVYADLIAPDAPAGLTTVTSGKDVTLTWTANSEPDLNGYYIYRIKGGKARLNYTPVNTATYVDADVADGLYTYEITAVDLKNNESKTSNTASAKIYAPVVLHPFTPVASSSLTIQGSAEPNASVEISHESASGLSSPALVVADTQGKFSVENLMLSPGENRITAKATDGLGNTSRTSDATVVVYDEAPLPPTGLMAAVQDYSVALIWNPNIEEDVAGYNLYRDGERVNKSLAVTQGLTVASLSESYYDSSYNAFDGNPNTYWGSYKSYGTFYPQWWELDLSAPELIDHLEIQWGTAKDSLGKEILYAGSEFEIQAWSGFAWVTLAKITGNSSKNNAVDFEPSYKTDKLRIYLTGTTDTNTYKQVRIAEMKILKNNLIPGAAYQDSALADKKYVYAVTAVDNYGLESNPSNEATATVGDVMPPSKPLGLAAATTASAVTLDWSLSPNLETDLAGYHVYRKSGQGWVRLDTSSIPGTSFADPGLANGIYTYRITAVDQIGNESAPSDEVQAIISVALPPPPPNLRITPVYQGKALTAAWDPSGESALSYNLYRGVTTGGPYTIVNSLSITSLSYLDQGLANGTPYFYVATAVDETGNESAYSSEASAVSTDVEVPVKPSISFPTSAGMQAVLYQNSTDIVGLAEPGVAVELFKDGISQGTTVPVETDRVLKTALDYTGYSASLSPTGNAVAYYYNSLWLKDVSGVAKQVIANGTSTQSSLICRKSVFGYHTEKKRLSHSDLFVCKTLDLDTANCFYLE